MVVGDALLILIFLFFRAAFRSLRTYIIELVLATDMAKHFEHLTKFNVLIAVSNKQPSAYVPLLTFLLHMLG